MLITTKTVIVNGHVSDETLYVDCEGKEFTSLRYLLEDWFRTQGDFYEEILGVSLKDATIADWHPDDKDFNSNCDGWGTMLNCKGIITKTTTLNSGEIDITDLLFPDRNPVKLSPVTIFDIGCQKFQYNPNTGKIKNVPNAEDKVCTCDKCKEINGQEWGVGDRIPSDIHGYKTCRYIAETNEAIAAFGMKLEEREDGETGEEFLRIVAVKE